MYLYSGGGVTVVEGGGGEEVVVAWMKASVTPIIRTLQFDTVRVLKKVVILCRGKRRHV